MNEPFASSPSSPGTNRGDSPPAAGLAIASLVLSLVGLGVVGVICGHIALSKIRQSGGALGGRGLAIAGLIIGYLSILAAIVVIVAAAGIIAVTVPKVRSAANEAMVMVDAQQLKVAILSYRTEYLRYPVNGTTGDDTVLTSDADTIALLQGEVESPLNPRRVPFLSIRAESKDASGRFVDTWGQPYEIHLDTNEDNRLEIDGAEVLTTVFIRSAGPDGEMGTEDDVRTD